ncbi:unnamed protein product [Ixodes pacificus]
MYCAHFFGCFKFWGWALSVNWADAWYSTVVIRYRKFGCYRTKLCFLHLKRVDALRHAVLLHYLFPPA